MIELTNTTASAIASAFVKDRLKAGSPAMGMVLTLIVVVDEDHADQAMTSARMAAHEHPARSLGVILGDPPLFPHHEEVEESWRILDPIIDYWARKGGRPEQYPSGGWGPESATAMLARDSRLWRRP